ncbi:MAG: helix-turn-helix transcriptional regulator [Clostridia bacterium]|nr:helix-turn-helix transcriptional regulator [Clostridia bacterium]
MELNEKLQELRKRRGLTQEELAAQLFVSRTAISKWESGRGYPSIDSLKAISTFFSISIDELLSGEELLNIAEADQSRKERQFRDLVFGLLDLCAAMLVFLPFFALRMDEGIQNASLLELTGIPSYLQAAYWMVAIGLLGFGIAVLALQNCRKPFWLCCKNRLSLLLSSMGVFVFMISLQPYAAVYLFVFLIVKALTLLKWS